MKGVMLCGGLGTRLSPLTDVTNKHLLPVFDRPMCYWPLQTLVTLGVSEVLLIVGGHSPGEFIRLLRDGRQFGFRRLYYAAQTGDDKGIADAIALAEEFVGQESFVVILGDNVFLGDLTEARAGFLAQRRGARIVLVKVPDPRAYGCPEFGVTGRITRVVEKPDAPASPYGVTGLYFFDPTAFDKVAALFPSPRGQLEVSDLISDYAVEGSLEHTIFGGRWFDAGESIQRYHDVSLEVRK